MARNRILRVPPLAVRVPGFPGTPVTPTSQASAGVLPEFAAADHTHPLKETPSSGGGLSVNRLTASVFGSGQLFATATPVQYLFGLVIEDPSSNWDAANHRWTIPQTGVYLVEFDVQISGKCESIESTIQCSSGTNQTAWTFCGESVGGTGTPNQPSHHNGMILTPQDVSAGDTVEIDSFTIWSTVSRRAVGGTPRFSIMCLGVGS